MRFACGVGHVPIICRRTQCIISRFGRTCELSFWLWQESFSHMICDEVSSDCSFSESMCLKHWRLQAISSMHGTLHMVEAVVSCNLQKTQYNFMRYAWSILLQLPCLGTWMDINMYIYVYICSFTFRHIGLFTPIHVYIHIYTCM